MTRPTLLGPLLALGLSFLVTAPAFGADRDGDLLRDSFETRWGITDADVADSDGDGVIDSAQDSDGDRLSDLGEQRYGTDPGSPDSDNDGRADGKEDADGNGLSNAREQDRRPLPQGLRPTLASAKADYPWIREACFAGLGVAVPLRCVFGDKESDTTVAVYGDSHALMWAPALIGAAKTEGWKLVTFFKGGCPSLYVRSRGQMELDGHRSCQEWRAGVLDALARERADLIVITNSDGYKVVDALGKRIDPAERPRVWKSGLARMLADLPDEAAALVLGDVPQNEHDPIKCLASNRQDMSACASRREPPRIRLIESVERAVAADAGAEFRTLYDKVCSYDPCPLVQGKVLMWRDAGHLSTTLVNKLTPSMRLLLREVLAAVAEPAGPSAASDQPLGPTSPMTLAEWPLRIRQP